MRFHAVILLLLVAAMPIVAQNRARKPKKTPQPPAATVEEHRVLAPGAEYIFYSYPKERWRVHTLRIDLSRHDIQPAIYKGLDNIAGLERVFDIARRRDSIDPTRSVLAGVNANFWKAGTNHPIGPTVSNGLIINNLKYKNWSSVAFTQSGKTIIDNFALESAIRTRFGDIRIDRFNSRRDSLSVVVYTPYFGTTVPFIDTLGILAASKDTITDDSETENIVSLAIDSMWSSLQEAGTLKMQFEYIGRPFANTFVPCRVTAIDTGIVAIPRSGGVISFGLGSFPLFFSLFEGDTFSLATSLIPAVSEPIVHMACGTPRLVRDGKVSVEWQEEGLRKKRFVTGKYGRSAIGTTRDGETLILMVVEATSRAKGRRGISLPDLADLMAKEGAYQAMNFDGGSSATMLVDTMTVAPALGTRVSRKISTSLLILTNDTNNSSDRAINRTAGGKENAVGGGR